MAVVGCRQSYVSPCHCPVDHLRCRNSRQLDSVGGAGVASKSFAGRDSAVRWISGRLRHRSDARHCLGQGLCRIAKKLAVWEHLLQVNVHVAIRDDELFHMGFGRSLN